MKRIATAGPIPNDTVSIRSGFPAELRAKIESSLLAYAETDAGKRTVSLVGALHGEIGPLVPSSASPDHGVPFMEIFERYDRDFYRIDPHLFSPAMVTLVNLDSGRGFRFGRFEPDILRRSFGIEGPP